MLVDEYLEVKINPFESQARLHLSFRGLLILLAYLLPFTSYSRKFDSATTDWHSGASSVGHNSIRKPDHDFLKEVY